MKLRIGMLALAALAVRAQDLPSVLQSAGFQRFYNLDFEGAQREFEKQVAGNPQAPEGYNLIAQAVIFRVMYRAGALESSLVGDKNPFFDRPKANMTSEEERLFLESLRKASGLARARLARDPKDAAALYQLGVAQGLRADYDFVVKKAWIATLRDFTQARKYHNRVSELDPANIDARLTQGMHTYIAGNLVFPWKQLGFVAGFHGDKETGIRILREVAERGAYNKADAAIFLIAILRRDHRPAEALPLVETLIRWFPANYIFRFEQVHLYLDLKEKEKAQERIAELERLKLAGSPGFEKLPTNKLAELKQAANAL